MSVTKNQTIQMTQEIVDAFESENIEDICDNKEKLKEVIKEDVSMACEMKKSLMWSYVQKIEILCDSHDSRTANVLN